MCVCAVNGIVGISRWTLLIDTFPSKYYYSWDGIDMKKRKLKYYYNISTDWVRKKKKQWKWGNMYFFVIKCINKW